MGDVSGEWPRLSPVGKLSLANATVVDPRQFDPLTRRIPLELSEHHRCRPRCLFVPGNVEGHRLGAWALGLFAFAALIVLAGCGGGSDDVSVPSSVSPDARPETTAAPETSAPIEDSEPFLADQVQEMQSPFLVVDETRVVTVVDDFAAPGEGGAGTGRSNKALALWDLETGEHIDYPLMVATSQITQIDRPRDVSGPVVAGGDVWVVQPAEGEVNTSGRQISDPTRIVQLDGTTFDVIETHAVPDDDYVERIVSTGDGVALLTRSNGRRANDDRSATDLDGGLDDLVWNLRSLDEGGVFSEPVMLDRQSLRDMMGNTALPGTEWADIVATPDGRRIVALLDEVVVVYDSSTLAETARASVAPEDSDGIWGAWMAWGNLLASDSWVLVGPERREQSLDLPDLADPQPFEVERPTVIEGDVGYELSADLYDVVAVRTAIEVSPAWPLGAASQFADSLSVDGQCQIVSADAFDGDIWVLTSCGIVVAER